jgi:ribosome-associated protein
LSTISLTSTPKKHSRAITRINRNSKLFKTILLAIQEKKAEEVVSLDLRKIPEAVADFFIICQATSTTQVKAIADNIEHKVKEMCLELPYRHEGMNAAQWVLVDYINIVIHIFQPETRKFYRLEEMWSDAEVQEHE